MDRTRFVIDHMSHFDGNIMEFARFLKSRWVGDQNFTVRSWSNYLYRLQDQGKISLAYEKKDYDAMLPQTWDGSQSELARLMWRRDDSITLKAWANRVQQAYQRGSINRTQHPEFESKRQRRRPVVGD
jgi:hypothetical protein